MFLLFLFTFSSQTGGGAAAVVASADSGSPYSPLLPLNMQPPARGEKGPSYHGRKMGFNPTPQFIFPHAPAVYPDWKGLGLACKPHGLCALGACLNVDDK